jgi:hypothetical protein
MIIQATMSCHKPVCLLLAQWPDHTSATALDGHGISQDHIYGTRGCSPRPPRHRGRLQLCPGQLQLRFSVLQKEFEHLVPATTCSQACQ